MTVEEKPLQPALVNINLRAQLAFTLRESYAVKPAPTRMEHIKTILPIALVITSTIFVALGAKTCAKADKSTDNGEKENHFLSGIAAFLLAGFLVLLAIFIKTSTL